MRTIFLGIIALSSVALNINAQTTNTNSTAEANEYRPVKPIKVGDGFTTPFTAGTNGGRVIMSVGLTPEQATRIREETKDLPEMSDLQAKLVAAQKDAIAYAIEGSPTDEKLKGKLNAVAQIQSQIALLRFKHGIKAVLPTVSDAQKEQMLQTASFSYNQLFFGSTGQVGFGAQSGRSVPQN